LQARLKEAELAGTLMTTGRISMKRKVGVVLAAGVLALVAAAPASADQPPGQLGYEGQPGNQGGASGNPGGGQPPGLLGYEGQPGNQGGH
jgi:hypothetical protein